MNKLIAFFFFSLLIGSCQFVQMQETTVSSETKTEKDTLLRTGGVKLITLESGHQIWTKKVGSGAAKVLVLHGGPGLSHDYLTCFEDFLPAAGYEVYFYDQLGCGNSENPADTSLWKIERYCDEIEQVRKALGIESIYLYGHSWGAMLALEYTTKYQSNLKGLILSNMTADNRRFQTYANAQRKKILSQKENLFFDSLYTAGNWSSPGYQALLFSNLYNQMLCRIKPWPSPQMVSLRKLNQNLYQHLMGADEFHINGTCRNWNRWDALAGIDVPTLVIGGKYDLVNPNDIAEMGKKIPNARSFICPEGSQMSMYDNQPVYFAELLRFIKQVEEGNFNQEAAPES